MAAFVPTPNPDEFDKVNYVIDAWARPCDAPWYIYAEALKPAALTAFIVLITFGWDDVFRGFFRPKGLGSKRFRKKKGKGKWRPRRFPELGELIGSKLPGATEVKGEQWSRLGKTLWRIDAPIQNVLFWWLVADVTNDFAFNFTSVLYQTRWCQTSNLGRFSFHDNDEFNRPPGFWFRVQFLIEDYEFPQPSWAAVSGNAGPNGAKVGAGIAFKPFLDSPPADSIELRIVDDDTRKVYKTSGPINPGPSGLLDCPIFGDVPPGRRFRIEVRSEGSAVTYGRRAVTGFEME